MMNKYSSIVTSFHLAFKINRNEFRKIVITVSQCLFLCVSSPQFAALAKNPDIIVAAPGRLVHLLLEVRDFSLKAVEYLVFDEADRLFEVCSKKMQMWRQW
jgi:superfamily II DNA/RNA helicase